MRGGWSILPLEWRAHSSALSPPAGKVNFDCYRHQRLGKDFSHLLEMTNKIAKLSSRTKREIFPNCTTTQTLNWVRLANRFQVRIRLDDRDAEHPFRMGTTVVVTIRGFSGGTASAPRAR